MSLSDRRGSSIVMDMTRHATTNASKTVDGHWMRVAPKKLQPSIISLLVPSSLPMPPRNKQQKRESRVPRTVIKRMVYAAGAYRMSKDANDMINTYIHDEIDAIVERSKIIAIHNHRKTLMADYLAMVLKQANFVAY